MDLEPSGFNLISPHLVMKLDVIQNGVNKPLNVWVLVTEKLKDYRDHLNLAQNDVPCWSEEQEFEESVQDLLNHLIILLLGSEKILEHVYEVRGGYHLSDIFSSANSRNQHDAF